ncbi:MAG: endonuclease/exonuclease/phosphatase family protein [Dehalococcoidia bacterium]
MAASIVGMFGLLIFIAIRVYRPDTNLIFIWADAYTFWLYLPAYPVLALGVALRRWVLVGLAITVASFHLAWVLPDYRPAESIPAEALSAPHIRLMSANVYFLNPDYSGIAREVKQQDPDILLIQEFGPRVHTALVAEGVADDYSYQEFAFENEHFGVALYSKLPLSDVQVLEAGNRPLIRALVDVEGTPVVLYDLHPVSPGFGVDVAEGWNDGWKTITGLVAKETGPVILAGDLNMDQHHVWYHKLKSQGLDNCHEETGRGNATTWPKGRKLRPIRIDHVFHSEGVVCLSIREGIGEGSDHRPLIAELAILPN